MEAGTRVGPEGAPPIPPIALQDWKPDHRPITFESRSAVAEYLTAIIRRDPEMRQASLDVQYSFANYLWRRFRDRYDEPCRSDREDLARAMRAI